MPPKYQSLRGNRGRCSRGRSQQRISIERDFSSTITSNSEPSKVNESLNQTSIEFKTVNVEKEKCRGRCSRGKSQKRISIKRDFSSTITSNSEPSKEDESLKQLPIKIQTVDVKKEKCRARCNRGKSQNRMSTEHTLSTTIISNSKPTKENESLKQIPIKIQTVDVEKEKFGARCNRGRCSRGKLQNRISTERTLSTTIISNSELTKENESLKQIPIKIQTVDVEKEKFGARCNRGRCSRGKLQNRMSTERTLSTTIISNSEPTKENESLKQVPIKIQTVDVEKEKCRARCNRGRCSRGKLQKRMSTERTLSFTMISNCEPTKENESLKQSSIKIQTDNVEKEIPLFKLEPIYIKSEIVRSIMNEESNLTNAKLDYVQWELESMLTSSIVCRNTINNQLQLFESMQFDCSQQNTDCSLKTLYRPLAAFSNVFPLIDNRENDFKFIFINDDPPEQNKSANEFWSYVNPYLAHVQEEDINWLQDLVRSYDNNLYEIPPLGKPVLSPLKANSDEDCDEILEELIKCKSMLAKLQENNKNQLTNLLEKCRNDYHQQIIINDCKQLDKKILNFGRHQSDLLQKGKKYTQHLTENHNLQSLLDQRNSYLNQLQQLRAFEPNNLITSFDLNSSKSDSFIDHVKKQFKYNTSVEKEVEIVSDDDSIKQDGIR